MKNCVEKVNFGPNFGDVDVVQLAADAFHNACLQVNSISTDNTGLRMHAGAHVAIRFLLRYPHLIDNLRLCELGCGTGVFGLIGTRGGTVSSHLLLTDGNADTVKIASKNSQQLVVSPSTSKVSSCQLSWGGKADIDRLFALEALRVNSELFSSKSEVGIVMQPNKSEEVNLDSYATLSSEPISTRSIGQPLFFDVVIGCELFYYRTSVHDLLYTVLQLTDSTGIFVHSHVFRRPGQDLELIEYLDGHGWTTAEIPLQLFVGILELEHHPEWYGVRCLVSGPSERIRALLTEENMLIGRENTRETNLDNSEILQCAELKWKIFRGVSEDVEESSTSGAASACCDINDGMDIANLFAKSR